MNDDAPVIYGLEFQGRSLCAQQGDTESIRFLVGTQSLKSTNQIHLIDFDEESNIICKYVFEHSLGEIWHISSSPSDSSIVTTCYNTIVNNKTKTKAAILQIPPLDDLEPPVLSEISSNEPTSPHLSLQCLSEINEEHGDVFKVLWNPSVETNKLLTISERYVDLWSCSNGTVQHIDSIELEGKPQLQYSVGRFNPHHNGSQIATGVDTCIKGYDLRSMKSSFNIENAHSQLIRDLDFNPNKQYYLATCSDDCKVKFWDTRNVSKPLMIRSDHSHWVWCVRYNNFHDQLVLTSSSDSRVLLSNIASLSSEPYGHLEEDGDDVTSPREAEPDRVMSCFDEHEDSVYAVDWSSADPWVFASLSFDGRLVINRVPRAEKYKILL